VPARGRGELARLMLDKALLVDPHHIAAHCNKAVLLSTEVRSCLRACKLSAKKNGLRLCIKCLKVQPRLEFTALARASCAESLSA
jgi:hypothetical protein